MLPSLKNLPLNQYLSIIKKIEFLKIVYKILLGSQNRYYVMLGNYLLPLGFSAGFVCVCLSVSTDLCPRIYVNVGRDLRAHLVQTILFVAALSKVTQLVICTARTCTQGRLIFLHSG